MADIKVDEQVETQPPVSVEAAGFNTDIPPEETTEEEALPFWRVFLYSLGNAAGLLTYQTFNTFITFFYIDQVKLPSHWVGRGWFAFGFWNAVNDPIAGWLSDHTQSKIGRRTFYIRLMAIPVAVSFALVWLPPLNVEEHGALPVMVYFLVIISIYDMLQSIITLNQDALFPEMFADTRTRARGAALRHFIGFALGVGVAVSLSPAIYEGPLGWTGLALIWGTVAAVFYFLSLVGIQENPAFAAEAENEPIFSQFRLALRNSIFVIVLAINFVMRFIVAVMLAVLPWYAKYVLELDGGQTSIMTSSFVVAVALSLILWQIVFRWTGSRRAILISFTLSAIFAIPLMFISSLGAAVVVLVILGLVVGGSALGPDMLFAELIDEDFVRTGKRREGLYRGILGFMIRFPPAFAGLLLGELIAMTGYDADLGVGGQPEGFITMLRVFTGSGIVASVVVGIFMMLFYPLHGERLARIQTQASRLRTELNRKHRQKKSAASQT